MTPTEALGNRLRDLKARSAATDLQSAENLAQLQQAGQALAESMANLSDALAEVARLG